MWLLLIAITIIIIVATTTTTPTPTPTTTTTIVTRVIVNSNEAPIRSQEALVQLRLAAPCCVGFLTNRRLFCFRV